MDAQRLERRSADRRAIPVVAYFSMEIGLRPDLPTYSGGLGILAGDTLRAAADHGLPLAGVTLVHREGYFRQRLDAEGNQVEEPATWTPESRLAPLDARVDLVLEGRVVRIRAWRFVVEGALGRVPVYLLDTNLPENPPEYRGITDRLYGGDARLRLLQEAVLGIGGTAMLRTLGHEGIATYHMNEGHSALLGLALLQAAAARKGMARPDDAVIAGVRRHCVFTTHTPVPAGHDRFPLGLVTEVLGADSVELLRLLGCAGGEMLNMTELALRLSHFVNGVAMRHREVSSSMFPEYPVDSITNGVHAATWMSPPFQDLFDRHIPEWRLENFNLRYAVGIPLEDVAAAHATAKGRLLVELERRTGRRLEPSTFTIGAARRAAAYKRADLVFFDAERLRRIARRAGGLQILFAGKAHPRDDGGKEIIRRITAAAGRLAPDIPILYLEDYDMPLASYLVAGVDVWLNTPQRPQEASGTSGMKAALNGVPSLSVLDGWWIEGHVEGVTGWSIGDGWRGEVDAAMEADSLYAKLENIILPLYYQDPNRFVQIMRSTISLNGSFFTAERMVMQYAKAAYGLGGRAWLPPLPDPNGQALVHAR